MWKYRLQNGGHLVAASMSWYKAVCGHKESLKVATYYANIDIIVFISFDGCLTILNGGNNKSVYGVNDSGHKTCKQRFCLHVTFSRPNSLIHFSMCGHTVANGIFINSLNSNIIMNVLVFQLNGFVGVCGVSVSIFVWHCVTFYINFIKCFEEAKLYYLVLFYFSFSFLFLRINHIKRNHHLHWLH